MVHDPTLSLVCDAGSQEERYPYKVSVVTKVHIKNFSLILCMVIFGRRPVTHPTKYVGSG